jgi:nucleoside-diphosphate-sugar epimerase
VASPFQINGTEDQIIKPAIQGTESVLKACRDFQLKKCIFTSSLAAVSGPYNIKENYNDKDFANPNADKMDVYSKSKILSDQLVWSFKKTLPSDSKLELITMHPGFIVGILFVTI